MTQARPYRTAQAAASLRDPTPSLERMWLTCVAAVRCVTNSAVAISQLECPAATSRSTSATRGLADSVAAVAFLLLAVVISAVGLTVLYLRNRPPTSFDASIDNFRREMEALAPRDGEVRTRRWWKR